MKVLDADILTYALYEPHPAHTYCLIVLERALTGKEALATPLTVPLEAYWALVRDYYVHPEEAHFRIYSILRSRKINFVSVTKELTQTALTFSKNERIPPSDGVLFATVQLLNAAIIISNDKHVERVCRKLGIVFEDPIPNEVRKRMEI